MKKIISITILCCLSVHTHTISQHSSPAALLDFPASTPLPAHTEAAKAHAAPGLKGRPFIRNYNPKEYGATFNYWAIAQDARGVMYFGNWNGVLEYDGVSWRLISTPNKSGVRSLAVDTSDTSGPGYGRIYVGAVGDLGYLAPDALGNMHFVSLLDHVEPGNREFNEVWYSHVTAQGVYFRTDKILLRWANERMQTWKPRTSFSGLFVVRDRVYMQQWGIGLHELAGDSLRLAPAGARFAGEHIYLMLPFGREKILIGTRAQGLFLYDGASFHTFHTDLATAQFLRANHLSHGALLPDGTFALATLRGGVAIVDAQGRLLQLLDQAAGLQENDVNFILADRQGGIWLAQGRGLARVENAAGLSQYAAPAGIKDFVSSIIRHRGNLYVATGLGVFYLPSRPIATNSHTLSPWPRAPEFQPLEGITAQSWSLLAAGNTLLAATNEGVYQIEGARAAFVKKSVGDSFFSMSLQRAKHDSHLVYVGLRDGLAALRYDPAASRWIDEGRIPGIHEPIWSIVASEERRLWLGTEAQGVLQVSLPEAISREMRWQEKTRVERFDYRNGLPKGWVGVYTIHGRTIFTSDEGIFRFDRATNRFFPDSTYGSMFADGSRDVEVVAEDQHGNVWLGSEEAAEINRAVRQADGSFVPEKEASFHLAKTAIWTIYPEPHRLPGAASSVVWFGGPEGLLRYDAGMPKRERGDYAALIRRITLPQKSGADSVLFGGADRESEGRKQPPTLAYAHNALRFEFAAPSFENESANQFQCFLEGFDQGWSTWSKAAEKDYTNLSEGEYRFHVRARNVYQQESREAVYAFKILPPWYRTWQAYWAGATLAGAILFGLRRYDMRRQKQRAEHQRRVKELEEARLLQLSMLPQEIPQLPHLELAAYMKPATEVGGDYYDFCSSREGGVILAVGDATGHGLKAGTMVTAMKSLFLALAPNSALAEVFQQSSQALKRMNLRQIYMTLLLARIDGARLALCGGGMPPVLIYRAATQQVEEIDLKGIPLGWVADFRYEQQELEFLAGDVILMMSDGFPERLNPRGETLGYEKAKALLAQAATETPQRIIARFVQASEDWARGRPQNDDTTFVVVKAKE